MPCPPSAHPISPTNHLEGDNLDILRGLNSACSDLIYSAPLFNSSRGSNPVARSIFYTALIPNREAGNNGRISTG